MPFDLKNTPKFFSQIVIENFRELIHKFIEVYMDDWMVYSLLREHVVLLCLMFDRCKELQISLNLRKCIFFVPHRILLGHIVCQEGVLVDPAKIMVIVNIPPPTSAKQLCSMMGHIEYYHRFIRRHANITAALENILNKLQVL
jgi:hypothetical protein